MVRVLKRIKNIKRLMLYIKNAGIYFFSSLFVALVGVLLNPLYAMNLSHVDYAILGYYSSFNLLLIPLLHFCLISFYSRQYYFVKENEREELGNTVLLGLMSIGGVSLILFLVIFYVVHSVMEVEFSFFPYALLTFLQLYISNIITYHLTKLRIVRKATEFAKVTIVQCLITSALTLLLVVYYKFGADGKLWGALIATAIIATYSLMKSITRFAIDKDIMKQGVMFCWPLVVSALLWYFFTGVDRMFLERLGDVEQLGLYNVGVGIAGYMQIFFTTLNNTFQPDIFQSIALKQMRKLVYIMGTIMVTVVIVNLAFLVLAPFIIGILTAHRYTDSSSFAQILSLQNITMALYFMVINIIVAYGYTKQEMYIRMIGAFISVITFKILIANWHFYGAAWGQVFSFLLMAVLAGGFVIVKYYKLRKTKM